MRKYLTSVSFFCLFLTKRKLEESYVSSEIVYEVWCVVWGKERTCGGKGREGSGMEKVGCTELYTIICTVIPRIGISFPFFLFITQQ